MSDYSSEDENARTVTYGAKDGPTSPAEIRSWYVYDFANSPYFQVYALAIMPILLKWLAESYALGEGKTESDSTSFFPNVNVTANSTSTEQGVYIPGLGITAGSYPVIINWFTNFLQMICLLSFSAVGDYGDRRKSLMRTLTYAGAAFVFLNILCFHGSMWWFAGIIRIFAGACFCLCNVYYNSYMPVLASAHHEVVGLEGSERTDMEIAVSDRMSSYGMMIGYAGGLASQVVSFLILYGFECHRTLETECTDFQVFFPPCVCIALVAVWWVGFSVYTFQKLKTRGGPAVPRGVNVLCLGWKEAGATLCLIARVRPTLLFIISYFISSDALATLCTIAVLILEDEADAAMSAIILNCILAAIVSLLGVLFFAKLQQYFGLTGKSILVSQMCIYGIVCVGGAFGLCTAFGGNGFYLVMLPVMLMMGSLQAYNRSLFSSLTPVGKEASMFAFYAISDKGSNLVGAGVIALVHNLTKSYVPVFWYLALAFLLAAVLMFFIDVEEGLVAAGKAEDATESSSE